MHHTSETVLPAHISHKSLVDMFASFFSKKISQIGDAFSNSGSFNDPLNMTPPAFNVFVPVTEDEACNIINEFPTKLCLLDCLSTFILKDCLDIPLPSITKLIIYSLIEGSFPYAFKKVVVTLSYKRLPYPEMT